MSISLPLAIELANGVDVVDSGLDELQMLFSEHMQLEFEERKMKHPRTNFDEP